LYVFGTFDLMETTEISENEIVYCGKTLIQFAWDDNFLMPIFKVLNYKYKFIEDIQKLFIEHAKSKDNVVLEHLTLPDRGFRFWTTNTDNNTKIYTGEIVYTPIFYTSNDEDAIHYSKGYTASKIASIRELEKYHKEQAEKYLNEEEKNFDLLNQ
jgi:hypothetical protein